MGWKFEIAKMFMYLSFPVAIFHYFNQPEIFEEWVIKAKKEHFPPLSRKMLEDVDKFIHDYNVNIEKKRLEEMEKQIKSQEIKS